MSERELTGDEAFRIASFGIEHKPELRILQVTATYGLDRTIWHKAWLDAVTPTLAAPREVGCGVRSVRQWFRELRAADFERDVLNFSAVTRQPMRAVMRWDRLRRSRERWTLFDTLDVVDRETAATYRANNWWYREPTIYPLFSSTVHVSESPRTLADAIAATKRRGAGW